MTSWARNMKIIHVIPNLRKGGAERLVLNICNQLHTHTRHEVLLITFSWDNAYEFLTGDINWKVVPSDVVPSISGKAHIDVAELQQTISSFQPDIVHAHLFKSMMVLSQVDFGAAHSFIHFHDNMHQLGSFSIGKIADKTSWTNLYEKRMLYRSFSNRSVSAVAISNDTSRYAQSILPKGIKVHKLLNAIDWKRFYSEVNQTCSKRIAMIGSLVEKKNQLLAIKTVQELTSRNVAVHLDLIGDGVLRDYLEEYVRSHQLEEAVTFHGSIDHPESVLSKACLYIHTAKLEPFGLVLIEAMAAGLPVVCTDGGGNRDLMNEGSNGFMVEEFSEQQLADKIEYLLNHTEERFKMGQEAQTFSKKFDISSYTDQLIKLYENAQNKY